MRDEHRSKRLTEQSINSPERWAPQSRDAMPVMSREHLQQVERKERHKHWEHIDTPQVVYTHAPLSRERRSQSPWLHRTHVQCCSFIHVDALKTYTKEGRKIIRGEMTRKYNFQWLFTLFLEEITLWHEGQSTPSLIYHRGKLWPDSDRRQHRQQFLK